MKHKSGFLIKAVVWATVVSLASPGAYANPAGGNVASGNATISTSGQTLTVDQTSNKALIDWQSFNIAPNETTKFIQPKASSLTVNQINDSKPSSIWGTLSANGNLVLINQNGIIFQQGSKVDAAGLLATASNIDRNQFKNGNLSFTPGSNPNAQVINYGTITAKQAGLVGLVAPQVANNGIITAKLGKVSLASGDTYALDLAGDGLIEVQVTGNIGQQLVSNAGVIEANGGTVNLTAAAARQIVNSLVENSGIIQADTIGTKSGNVILNAEGSNANIAMSGDIKANGDKNGNGGKVSIVAGNNANFSGLIEAEGGTNSGNGGFVETSGSTLQVTGHVITTAPKGLMGNWLLDPTDINVVSGGGSSLSGSTIDPSYIVSGLNGSNVTLTAANTITVSNAINASGNAGGGNLILNAITDYLNSPITLKNGSALSGNATTVNVGSGGLVQNGVDAAAAGGIVNLAAATYNLTSEITIGKNLTMNGDPTSGSILNGQNETRVMEIDGTGGGITVNLNRLTLTNGNGMGTNDNGYGGGLTVYAESGNQATVNISNSTISGNSATGNPSYSGGGIYNDGLSSGNATMTISNSAISGNSASNNGGGIYNLGTAALTISNSTVSGNTASFGGGIFNDGREGGDNDVTLVINNSTISGNSASSVYGGGIENFGNVPLSNASLTIGDTILAGNTNSGGESDCRNDGGGTLTSLGHNLYGQNGNTGGFTPVGSDIELTGSINTVLTSLGNYGGPTQTMALVVGSPAYLAGGPVGSVTTDQRGVSRGSTISIGAYDYVPTSLVVNSTADTSGDVIGGSTMTLRDALFFANAGALTNPTITFNPAEFSSPETITLTQGELVINSSLTLTGPTAGVTLNANNASRVMEIDGTSGGITVNLSNLTMTNGNGLGTNDSGSGGALLVYAVSGNNATANIGNSSFVNNSGGDGGGIANVGNGTLTITNSTISNNSAGNNGGGIYNYGSTSNSNVASLIITNSTISGNSAAFGGGIHNDGRDGGAATLTIANSTISDNSESNAVYGGGIENVGNASLTIGDTILAGNTNGSGESDLNNGATLTSNGYNLYGQNGNAGGFVPAAHDVLLTGSINTVLTSLGNYGGPTETMALVLGSPAIDAGDPAQVGNMDQRGIVRGSPSAGTGSASDIGAYEAPIIAVSADNQQITAGQSAPTFTYTINSGPAGHLSGNPALITPETNVGVYNGDIGIGTIGLTSNEYLLNFTAGNYTIVAAQSGGGGSGSGGHSPAPPAPTPPTPAPPTPTPAPSPSPAPSALSLPDSVVQALDAPIVVPSANLGLMLPSPPSSVAAPVVDVAQSGPVPELVPDVGSKPQGKIEIDCNDASSKGNKRCQGHD